MSPKQSSRTRRWQSIASKTVNILKEAVVLVAFAPHFRVFRRGTYWPIRRILDSTDEIETRAALKDWCKYKEHEAGYVQVAGAVIFASVSSCLTWNAVKHSHWSGPAFMYGSIVLALACIFTGAQQTLVLPEPDTLDALDTQGIEKMRLAFADHSSRPDEPSGLALFSWQVPIMLLGYAVLCFLAGFCSVILSPLAKRPVWNDEAKIAVVFIIIAAFALACWLIPSKYVHRIRAQKHLD